jgi:aminoglycoside 3-N-acetyltransferase
MSLPKVTRHQIVEVLKAIGVQPADGLLVHSALQFLGQPEGGVAMYHKALQDVLGPEGTLAVPTFNFAFARGEDYDPANTPSEGMGVFSEYIRQLPGARRTTHPLQSLAVIGAHADDLVECDTPSAFDDGSAFDRMLQLGFKLLLLGAEVQAASMVHYSEQRAAVPYRYWKDFTGDMRLGGEWQQRTYRMYARHLDSDPQLRLKPIQEVLQAKGQWQAQALNYGWVSLCTLADFVAATDELLADDPWALIGNREEAQARMEV